MDCMDYIDYMCYILRINSRNNQHAIKVRIMLIGYARVSTKDQNLDMQLDALSKHGCERIYQEKQSGKSANDRSQLQAMLDAVRQGDTVVVYKLDRLGRSTKDLIEIVNTLQDKGVGFISLNEKIDTTGAMGKLVFQIFAALAEFERNVISERTKAGLEAAKARGRLGGRRNALTPKQQAEIVKMHAANTHTIKSMAELYGVSPRTISNTVAKAKA